MEAIKLIETDTYGFGDMFYGGSSLQNLEAFKLIETFHLVQLS